MGTLLTVWALADFAFGLALGGGRLSSLPPRPVPMPVVDRIFMSFHVIKPVVHLSEKQAKICSEFISGHLQYPLVSGVAEGQQTPGRVVFVSLGLTCLDPEIGLQKLAGMIDQTQVSKV